MQELKRLVQIVAANSSNTLPVIDFSDQTSLEGRLYHFVRNEQGISDEDACSYLYGEQKLTPSYRMLKSRLRKKLLNSLLIIDLTESHLRSSRVQHLQCLSLLQQATKLLVMGEFFLADKIADQIILIAQEVELNDMLAQAYEIKQNADLKYRDRNKFEKNLALLQRYQFLYAKEQESLVIYNRLKFEVSINVSHTRKQGDAYLENLLKLKELWEVTKSSNIFDRYHLMHMGYCEISGDYEGIIAGIEEAELLLAKGIVGKYWFNQLFNNYIKVYAYLRMGKLEEGLIASKLYLASFIEGSSNWFAFIENYLIIALHKGDYRLAVQLCKQVTGNSAFENLISRDRERWDLLLRYTRLISHEDDLMLSEIALQKEYEATIISKDKEGYNLPLLILEYLECLPRLDEEDMAQYAARFSKYTSKYLKDDAAARARIFIRLLLLSMKEDGKKLQQKSAPVLDELKNTPPPRDPIAEVEIIPYEHLWELVLDLVQQRVKQ